MVLLIGKGYKITQTSIFDLPEKLLCWPLCSEHAHNFILTLLKISNHTLNSYTLNHARLQNVCMYIYLKKTVFYICSIG